MGALVQAPLTEGSTTEEDDARIAKGRAGARGSHHRGRGPCVWCPAERTNYQVMLTDDADQPIAGQTVSVVLRIYDNERAERLRAPLFLSTCKQPDANFN